MLKFQFDMPFEYASHIQGEYLWNIRGSIFQEYALWI